MGSSTPNLHQILEAWGRTSARVVPLDDAPDRWRVEADVDDEPLLLRRYEAERSAAAIAFEHEVLAFLAEHSWPVPEPVATPSGSTFVEADGARWALLPLLPGELPPDESIFLQRRGALLALVHADLAAWDRPAPYEAARRVDDFDAVVQAHGLASFEALLARVQVVDGQRANTLAVLRMRVEEQLETYGYAQLRPLPLWRRCNAQHVLFDGNDVTGLIEFDARLDARTVDIAESILADTRSIGWRIIRWIAGYSAHADPPLGEQEADLIPVMMSALTLRHAASVLAAAHASTGIDETALATVDEALTMDAHEDDLREVIRTAARLAPLPDR